MPCLLGPATIARALVSKLTDAERIRFAAQIVAEVRDPSLFVPLSQLAELARRQADGLGVRQFHTLISMQEKTE